MTEDEYAYSAEESHNQVISEGAIRCSKLGSLQQTEGAIRCWTKRENSTMHVVQCYTYVNKDDHNK